MEIMQHHSYQLRQNNTKWSPSLSSMFAYFAQLDQFYYSCIPLTENEIHHHQEGVSTTTDEPFSLTLSQEEVQPIEWFIDRIVESDTLQTLAESELQGSKRGGILRSNGPNRPRKDTFKINLSTQEEDRLNHLEKSGKPRLKRQGTRWVVTDEEDEKRRINHLTFHCNNIEDLDIPSDTLNNTQQQQQQQRCRSLPLDKSSEIPKLIFTHVQQASSPLSHSPRSDLEHRGISPFKKSAITSPRNRASAPPSPAPQHADLFIPLSDNKSQQNNLDKNAPNSEKKSGASRLSTYGPSVSPFKKLGNFNLGLRSPRSSTVINTQEQGQVQLSESLPPRRVEVTIPDESKLRKSLTASPRRRKASDVGDYGPTSKAAISVKKKKI